MSGILSPVTANTAKRYFVGPGVAYLNFTDWANKGTLLGAIPEQGSKVDPGIEYHETKLGGSHGRVGLPRIKSIRPVATITLLEITYENLLRGLPGFTTADHAWTQVYGEILGTGAEVDLGVAPTGATDIDTDTLKVYRIPFAGGIPVLLALTTDYTIDPVTQKVTSTVAGAVLDDDTITCSYRYDDPTGDDFTIITPGDISASDMYDNIAIIGTISDGTLSYGGIIILENVLCLNGPGIELPGETEEETVLQQEWHASFLPGEEHLITNAPMKIWWPGAAV